MAFVPIERFLALLSHADGSEVKFFAVICYRFDTLPSLRRGMLFLTMIVCSCNVFTDHDVRTLSARNA